MTAAERSGESTSAEESALSVIRGLRYAGDEVQLGGVLAHLCRDPTVALQLVDAIVRESSGGSRAARRRARERPDEIICLGEQYLDVRRTRLGWRRRTSGRADLRFTSPGKPWSLVVELKLDAAFQKDQLKRYLKNNLVAVVLRNREQLRGQDPERLAKDPNFIGAVTWERMRSALTELRLSGRDAADWRALLEVMAGDHDFDPSRPRHTTEAKAGEAAFRAIADDVLAEFKRLLEARHGSRAQNLTSVLDVEAYPARSGWAWLEIFIKDPKRVWLVAFGVRDLSSSFPLLRFDYNPSGPRRVRRFDRKLLDASLTSVDDCYREEAPVSDLAGASPDNPRPLLTHLISRLEALVDTGVFELDLT